MKLSCCIGNGHKYIDPISTNGFRYCEPSLYGLNALEQSEVDSILDDAKRHYLTSCSFNGMFPSDAVLICGKDGYGKLEKYLEGALNKVKNFDSRHITLGSGAARNIPDGMPADEAKDMFVEVLKNCVVPYCSSRGYRVSIEPLRVQETNFLHNCREVSEIVNRVGDPALGLCIDYYHAILGGDTDQTFRDLGYMVRHVHTASPRRNRLYPDESDHADVKSFFTALKDIGYEGYISLEGDCGPDLYVSTLNAMKVMADVLLEI